MSSTSYWEIQILQLHSYTPESQTRVLVSSSDCYFWICFWFSIKVNQNSRENTEMAMLSVEPLCRWITCVCYDQHWGGERERLVVAVKHLPWQKMAGRCRHIFVYLPIWGKLQWNQIKTSEVAVAGFWCLSVARDSIPVLPLWSITAPYLWHRDNNVTVQMAAPYPPASEIQLNLPYKVPIFEKKKYIYFQQIWIYLWK